MEQLEIESPDLPEYDVSAVLSSARQFVGLWKGLRAQLRFGGDGRIHIEFDSQRNYALDETGLADYSQPVTQLVGTYRVVGEVIYVTWDDGSQLNYRWRLDNGRLLLTDHHGRVSQLHRLIE